MTTTPNEPNLALLCRARDRIANGFCRETYATNKTGGFALPFESAAVNFCAIGAIMADTEGYHIADEALDSPEGRALCGTLGHRDISGYSDKYGQVAVLDLYDKTIARLSAGDPV